MYSKYRSNKMAYNKLKKLISTGKVKNKPKKRVARNQLATVARPTVVSYPSVSSAPLYSKTKYSKLCYTEDFLISGSYLTAVNYVFRANGCHDPDYQIGGTQPYGWTQMKALYASYEVISSTIQVVWNPATLVNAPRYHFKIFKNKYANLDNLSLTDPDNLIEAPGSNLATIGHVDENAIRQFSTAKISFKKSDLFTKDQDTSALTTADPLAAETAYFVVSLFPSSGSVTTSISNTPFRVRITYNVRFKDPIQYVGS